MKVEELLEDAHLVASFGQRSGLLKSSDLFKAIQQAEEEKATLSWASPAAMQLQSAVNAAIPDIAPISLLNLREGFNPYNPVKKHAKRLRLTLIGSALLLLSVGAHFSIWQEGATDVLAEIAKNKFVIQQAIVDSLLPTVAELDKAGANFGELEDTNSLARSAFRAEVAEA